MITECGTNCLLLILTVIAVAIIFLLIDLVYMYFNSLVKKEKIK